MKRRLELFRNFCFPSILHQTCQNFKWLVFFDPKTPKHFMDELGYLRRYKNFVPVYGGGFVENVGKRLPPGTPFLITTRLDNDDALQIQAIQIVQEQFHRQNRLALNFPTGYCLEKKRLYLTRQTSNPFISLIERVHWKDGQPKFFTVMAPRHTRMNQFARLKQLEHGPMWLQIIHEDNLVNKLKGRKSSDHLKSIGKWFGLK